METRDTTRRIHILRDEVARKIAAGEVIDRPFSVVRELLDNSIDANSKNIEVRIVGGGIEEIRVRDDGIGMSRADLEVCYLSHATSKIEDIADIYRTQTLGFRGEALSSIATCSRLEIVSREQNADYAHRLVVEGGRLVELQKSAGVAGTTVSVSKLFYNMPARRGFLKSKSSESFMCKSVFLEKALPFPEISFKFFSNEKLSIFLPPSGLLERVFNAYGDLLVRELLMYDEYERGDVKIRLVAGDPSLMRRDRKFIQIFINGRRVNEYSLIKVVEYSFSGYVPGGYYPVCFVFIEINPKLVDFNVHPAKKEVKLRNLSLIKASVVEVISRNMRKLKIKVGGEKFPTGSSVDTMTYKRADSGVLDGLEGIDSPPIKFFLSEAVFGRDRNENESLSSGEIRYLGQIFNLFLLAVYRDTLLVVDQHAAHERILFDELMEKPLVSQELLFPIYFSVEGGNELSEEQIENFNSLGIKINRVASRRYEIVSLPEDFLVLEESELIDLVKETRSDTEGLKRKILDSVACKMAIKEGETIDEITAISLLERAVALKDARCPHGRPIWFSISRSELLRIVKRL